MAASVTFTPTPEQALAAAQVMRAPPWGRYERLRWVLAGALLGLLFLFVIATYDWRTWGLYIVRWQETASFAFGGAAMGWVYGRAKPAIPAGDPILRQRTVSIDDIGLRVEGRGFRTAIDWAVIEKISLSDDILLFVTEWKEAHFVPRQAFPAPRAADGFADAAQAAWTARRSGSLPQAGGDPS